jgi:hypothetical protein
VVACGGGGATAASNGGLINAGGGDGVMVGAATSSIDNSGYRSVRASGVGRMTVRLTTRVGEQSQTRGEGMWPEGSRN